MAIMRAALTESDLRVLVRGVSDDERAAAAHKICRRIEKGVGDDEREAAHQVLRIMAQDAAELVRRALAVTLKNSPDLPHDVAMRLAEDVDSIALPVLAYSPVFTDDDLAAIVRASGEMKQTAIARRPTLSETVTTALTECGGEEAVRIACANDNAAFSEPSLQAAVDRFSKSQAVANAIAYRKALPLSISERLVSLVSDSVREHLMDRHALSPETAMRIALGARERATVDLVEQAARASDLRAFAAHLNEQRRLTPSLLLRVLVYGNMAFFEWSIAELSGVPHRRAWLMIHDAGPLGLRAVYERAGLPVRLFPAFRVAVDTFHALQLEGGPMDAAAFQERLLQRFLTQSSSASAEDLDYLLERMDRLSRRAERALKGAA